MEKRITAPLTPEASHSLKAGDSVLLSGTVYAARDAAHKRLCELVERDVGLSFLPDYVTEEAVRQGRVVRLEVPELSVEVWKQLLHRRDKWISLPMGAMIRHLSEILLQETE